MRHYLQHLSQFNITALGFALASIILAYPPLVWLIHTWRDPSYQSTGAIYALITVLLVAWSVNSKRNQLSQRTQIPTILLLVFAALLRLASQVFAINILGGIALAIDVFALALLLGLQNRKRALSPLWISALFLFSLPFERIAQRILGYPMQEISATGACKLLGTAFDDLICEGIRLQVQGKDVLVDLPCSGTQSLMLCMAMFVALSALYRPRLLQAFQWGMITIALSIAGNCFRIFILALGLIYQNELGFNIMDEPTHSLVGYATIALSLFPLFWFYKNKVTTHRPLKTATPSSPKMRLNKYSSAFASASFVCLALLVTFLPRNAVDVSRKIPTLELPQRLSSFEQIPQRLEAVEETYFKQYGGTAQKAFYGSLALTIVQTTSPLRHLHSPSDCLRGLGYQIAFLGTKFEPVPTAIYKATSKNGDSWRVAVTFVSNSGQATSNVAEAIWSWLKTPNSEWNSIQRITPWNLEETIQNEYEHAVIAALDLPQHKNQ